MPRKPMSQSEAALKNGYKSGLEMLIADQLAEAGIDAPYEGYFMKYTVPSRIAKYTPDFVLPNGIVVESKGRFMTADRQKHLLISEQFPDLDLRFVFSNPNQRISKKSKTTYAMWCLKHGFRFATKLIPKEWMDERRLKARIEAVRSVLIAKKGN